MSGALFGEIGLLHIGDSTANRQCGKNGTACAARAAIFAKWAFGGVKAHFAKLQVKISLLVKRGPRQKLADIFIFLFSNSRIEGATRFLSDYSLKFCKMGFYTAKSPLCKNRSPCGTSVSGFYKLAIGGAVASLQNFS